MNLRAAYEGGTDPVEVEGGPSENGKRRERAAWSRSRRSNAPCMSIDSERSLVSQATECFYFRWLPLIVNATCNDDDAIHQYRWKLRCVVQTTLDLVGEEVE